MTTKTEIDPAAKIKIVAKENPKRPGTKAHKLFGLYKPGMTAQAYQDAVRAMRGVRPRRARSSLRYDLKHGYVTLVAPTPAPKKAPAKAA